MKLLFPLAATSVAAGDMMLDSLASGYRWEDQWEYVTQTGAQTGNNELQDYVPEQVQLDESKQGVSLVLQPAGERYVSGKIRSRRSLQELAPNGGAFELQFDLPKNVFATSERTWASDLAPWPVAGYLDSAARRAVAYGRRDRPCGDDAPQRTPEHGHVGVRDVALWTAGRG